MKQLIPIAFVLLLSFIAPVRSQSNSKAISKEKLNRAHVHDFYSISAPDSIELGNEYIAFIIIDTTKIKALNKIHALRYDILLERKKNKFRINFIPMHWGIISFDIKIIDSSASPPRIIKFTHSVYGIRPTKSRIIDYVGYAQQMPKFNSSQYTDFNDYIRKSILEKKIRTHGDLQIAYIVMTDGSTRFEEIKKNSLESFEDEDAVAQIIRSYSGWNPGVFDGKIVNVYISSTIKFK